MSKHHSFRCSSCDAPLADIEVTNPSEDVVWNIYAECCHCGDRSYTQTVHGWFAIGGTDETLSYTQMEDFDMDADPIVIKTVKVKDFK